MSFSSICMIHYAATNSLFGTMFWELLGPLLGFFYVRAQVEEPNYWKSFFLAFLCGIGFSIGGGSAILFIRYI